MSPREENPDQNAIDGSPSRSPDVNAADDVIIEQVIEAALADRPVRWINAVTEIRSRTGLSLKESNDAVRSYRKVVLGESLALKPSFYVAAAIYCVLIIGILYAFFTYNLVLGCTLGLLTALYIGVIIYPHVRVKRN